MIIIPASCTGDGAYNFGKNSLADVGLVVIAPFKAKVSRLGNDNYVAHFLAANVHASGDTADEAITNFKDVIRHLYWRLSTLPDAQLGCAARQQKGVLAQHLTYQCRKERYMSDAEATAKFAIRSVLIVDCEGLKVGNLDAIEQTVDRLLAAITSDAMWWSFEQVRSGK